MGLCLRICMASFLALAVNSSVESRPAQQFQKQADLCELLRDPHEEILNEYPNEYYDCHAHSYFFKMGSVTPKANDLSFERKAS